MHGWISAPTLQEPWDVKCSILRHRTVLPIMAVKIQAFKDNVVGSCTHTIPLSTLEISDAGSMFGHVQSFSDRMPRSPDLIQGPMAD